jgi:hypothetical protein
VSPRPESPAARPLGRTAVSGITALLLVGLLTGSAFATPPGARARDISQERIAVREITTSITRAVRELVGSDHHKPCLTLAYPVRSQSLRDARPGVRPAAFPATAACHVEVQFLDLPPPALS